MTHPSWFLANKSRGSCCKFRRYKFPKSNQNQLQIVVVRYGKCYVSFYLLVENETQVHPIPLIHTVNSRVIPTRGTAYLTDTHTLTAYYL